MDFHARRILLCLRYGIGDVVMELPVLRALRQALPRARVTALGAEPATELLEGSPDVDEVVSLNRWGLRHRWDRGPAGVERAISKWLNEHDFDLFLDVHHVTPVFGETVWSRGIRSLEADEAAERAALRRGENGVEAIKGAVHAGWGLEVAPWIMPRVTPPRKDRNFASEFLHRHGLGEASPLAISPVASMSLKRWSLDRLARLADHLVDRENGRPVLAFCGPQTEIAETLRNRMRHGQRLVCVGSMHLLRTAALLERCRAFVCNDTGLMHLSGALQVPTVAIFGPTASTIYAPPAAWVRSVGGQWGDCPHRQTTSLHPPACFTEGRCLIAEQGCIDRTEEMEVRKTLSELLDALDAQPRPATSVA